MNTDDLFESRGYGGHLPSIADRIDASGDCWEWTGRLNPKGYGQVGIRGTQRYVHRLVWEVLVGSIPEGLEIDHLCRVRCCCNPDHLEPVTHTENLRRGIGNGRVRKTHCPRGHPYLGDNLYVQSDGKRRCRACRSEEAARRKGQTKTTRQGEQS